MKKILILLSILITQFAFAENDKSEQWIVVTTIQYPTDAVKKLSNLKDWKLVVVGDKKTPKDWELPNCIYLSPEKQLELGYHSATVLPWNHYSRKNIGYLYAIQHGAKVIYETDDDNFLYNVIPITKSTEVKQEIRNNYNRAINIYACFGCPDTWPRGFPLDQLTQKEPLTYVKSKSCTIGVQQSLVDKDPDVDAIFRLTHGKEFYFPQKPPCIINLHNYCPYNSQNTLSHSDAFWGLYIPSTVSFRSCDIWRGYITQRLMRNANLSLCFTSPTAYQERNEHNLIKDFADEWECYTKVGKLLEALDTWKSSTLSLDFQMKNLFEELITKGFLKEKEIAILEAWILDLEKLGYQWPVSNE